MLKPLTAASQQWARSEFVLADVGRDGLNPYDPDTIAVDADVTSPDGRRTTVPLFWYVGFRRALETTADGKAEEIDTPDVNVVGEWRLRWTPRVAGRHVIAVTVRRGNETQRVPAIEVDAAPPATDARGFVSIEPTQKRFFKTDDGRPLPVLGMNACWPGKRKTYDYDDWLPAMGKNGMNYTRLWQGNAGFRCELYADERANYSQANLWQLDYVFDRAAEQKIEVMLCMGFHGEFQTKTDAWGHSGWWATHAYQTKNGGPCDKPNDFFTNPTAASLYRKRLRYLVARYGANPNLFSWQFFNEIDNIFAKPSTTRQADRDANHLHPADVIAWHDAMSRHLHSIDPFGHLVTTSFGSAEEYPDMWRLPGIDYSNWHWYTNWGGPFKAVTEMTAFVGRHFGPTYDKPVVIAEFGTDGRAWAGDNDAERRGLRQAIWGGLFTGTAGTAMPWFWEDIHRENLYPLWKSLRDFLPSDFGNAKWKTVAALRPASPPDVPLEHYVLSDGHTRLVWVVDNCFAWPRSRTIAATPLAGATLTLADWPAGRWDVQWWDTRQGRSLGTSQDTVDDGKLVLPLVPFVGDLAARLTPADAK